MINPKELIEDFLALGYDDYMAIQLAKEEFKRKQEEVRKNNLEAKNKRARAPRVNGFTYKVKI